MRKLLLLAAAVMALTMPLGASAEIIVGDAAADMLAIANTATGELTDYASVGTPHIVSLAYDMNSQVLYCSDTSEGVNQILQIDPHSGSTTLVVQVPDMWIVFHSMAVDPVTGDLYAIDQEHGDLYRVDVEAGQLVFVGNIGVYWITGADFDPISGELYIGIGGLDDGGALYTVDKNTAQATFVASTHRLMGLGFDLDGTLYGVNNYWYPDDPGLYRIDKNTGEWVELGTYPNRNLMSIEYVDLDVVRVESLSLTGVKRLFD